MNGDGSVIPARRVVAWRHAVIVLAMVAASCSGGVGGPTLSPSASPVHGGTLRVVDPIAEGQCAGARPTDTTLDAVLGCGADRSELFRCCLGRTLLSYNGRATAEGGSELRPDLAVALPDVSTDGLTWSFHIRPGLHYGPPLQNVEIVSSDVVRALQRTARLARPSPPYFSVIAGFDDYAAGRTASIAGLETPDAHTLVVRLSAQAGDLGYRLSTPYTVPIPPLRRDPAAPFGVLTGHDGGTGGLVVSSGPYVIEGSQALDVEAPVAEQRPPAGYVPGKSVTLVRNPSWSTDGDALRPALADRIAIDFSVDEAGAAAAIDAGRADVNMSLFPPPQAPLEQVAAYQSDQRRGRVDVQPRNGIRYVSMNLAVPPFDDLHVRRAVEYAVDRRALVDAFGGAITATATGHLALDSLEDNALLDFDPYRAPDAASRLQLAREEMAQSNYDRSHTGRCDAAVCAHVVELVKTGHNAPAGLGDIVHDDLAQIGIQADVIDLPVSKFFSELFDPTTRVPIAVGWGWGPDYPNGSDFFTALFTHDGIAAQSNYTLLGAQPDELRKWGYPVASVPSVDDRVQLCLPLVGGEQSRCWTAVDQYLMEKVAALVPILSENYVEVVPDRVKAYSFDAAWGLPALDHIAVAA